MCQNLGTDAVGREMIFRIVMKEDRDARNENEFW